MPSFGKVNVGKYGKVASSLTINIVSTESFTGAAFVRLAAHHVVLICRDFYSANRIFAPPKIPLASIPTVHF